MDGTGSLPFGDTGLSIFTSPVSEALRFSKLFPSFFLHVPSFPFNFGEFQEVQELILIYFHDISSASSIQHSLTSSKDTAPISEHQSAT